MSNQVILKIGIFGYKGGEIDVIQFHDSVEDAIMDDIENVDIDSGFDVFKEQAVQHIEERYNRNCAGTEDFVRKLYTVDKRFDDPDLIEYEDLDIDWDRVWDYINENWR